VQELLRGILSNIMVGGVLSQLGAYADIPVASAPHEYLLALRRRLERIGRSYLAPDQATRLLVRYDQLISPLGVVIPEEPPPPSTSRSVSQSGPIPVLRPNTAPSLRSLPPEPRDRAHSPALRFSFRERSDLDALKATILRELLLFLHDESTSGRLASSLERTALEVLTTGGGAIILERDAGLRGRLVFKVVNAHNEPHFTGAVFASVSR
jgi:hypothetical protein